MTVSGLAVPGTMIGGCGFCSGSAHGLTTRYWKCLPSQRNGPGRVQAAMMKSCAFFEALAVVGRVDVVGQLLDAAAAHEAGDQPAARDAVDHGQLFGQPQRVVDDRQRVAEHQILARLVILARIAPVILIDACMQNGAVWCSLIMMPSKPASSAT